MKVKMLSAAVILVLIGTIAIKAGDREEIQTSVRTTIDAFNKHDYIAYFSFFVDDNTEFPYVLSPLCNDAAGWKDFTEGTENPAFVSYQVQDDQIQIYKGNTAVVTAYCTSRRLEKDGTMKTQSRKASIVLVKKNRKWYTVHLHIPKMF